MLLRFFMSIAYDRWYVYGETFLTADDIESEFFYDMIMSTQL